MNRTYNFAVLIHSLTLSIDSGAFLSIKQLVWLDLYPSMLNSEVHVKTSGPVNHFQLSRTFKKYPSVQLMGDRLFVAPATEAVILQARHNKQPVYLYQYGRPSDQSLSQGMSGPLTNLDVAHGDDFARVVKFYDIDTLTNEDEKLVGELLIDILLGFARTG